LRPQRCGLFSLTGQLFAFEAMMQMTKIDIAAIEAARRG
jgi:predicted 3-demethylubiquinone-9 3-methyltransferase (glyoxalase superfamily)